MEALTFLLRFLLYMLHLPISLVSHIRLCITLLSIVHETATVFEMSLERAFERPARGDLRFTCRILCPFEVE